MKYLFLIMTVCLSISLIGEEMKFKDSTAAKSDATSAETTVENNRIDSLTISLKVGEVGKVFQGFSIKYKSYGHENSSSNPNEPFTATIGLYMFELSENDSTETITLYRGLRGTSQTIAWKNYKINMLSNSDDQKEVALGIKKYK